MIAIVTSRNFILCEAVNHMTLQCEPDFVRNKFVNFYTIDIDFQPVSRNNQSSNTGGPFSSRGEEKGYVRIKVRGEETALRLFKELVRQIREQVPDAAYLDKMVENILSGSIGDIHDEPGDASSSGARQEKRRSKKVLRRTKSSNKRSKR